MENLRLFYRLALRNREVYFLKLITLAIAFSSSVLILLFSINEFGYDRFHADAERIFRVLEKNNSENYSGIRLSNQVPEHIYQKMARDSSLTLSRVKTMNQQVIIADKTITRDITVHAADSSLMNIFSFDIPEGSKYKFRQNENVVLLSQSLATHLFGYAIVDKELKLCSWNDTISFRVAAVFDDFPSNSHEKFSVFIPFQNSLLHRLGFQSAALQIYGKLNAGEVAECDMTRFFDNEKQLVYSLQSLPEIYFGPRIFGDNAHHGDSYSILILVSITSLVLFLAVTGFINLTALTLPYRAKEIAIKNLQAMMCDSFCFLLRKNHLQFLLYHFSLVQGFSSPSVSGSLRYCRLM